MVILADRLTLLVCQFQEPSPDLPDKKLELLEPATLQYHIQLEQNDGKKSSTFEMNQYYDGPGNRAVTIFRSNGAELRIYVNGSNNERYTYIPTSKRSCFLNGYITISRFKSVKTLKTTCA
jgi:hypothetical protein